MSATPAITQLVQEAPMRLRGRRGVQLHITDAAALRPVALGVHVLAALRRGWPEQFAWLAPSAGARHFVDLLWSGDVLRRALDAGEDAAAIIAAMDAEAREFAHERGAWLLYMP